MKAGKMTQTVIASLILGLLSFGATAEISGSGAQVQGTIKVESVSPVEVSVEEKTIGTDAEMGAEVMNISVKLKSGSENLKTALQWVNGSEVTDGTSLQRSLSGSGNNENRLDVEFSADEVDLSEDKKYILSKQNGENTFNLYLLKNSASPDSFSVSMMAYAWTV